MKSRIAFLAICILAVALIASAITFPLNQQPASDCCGHPDEIPYAERSAAFTLFRPLGPGPTGFPFVTFAAHPIGFGWLAGRVLPEPRSNDPLARRIITGRLISLFAGLLTAWILWRLCVAAGIRDEWAVAAPGLLLFAPLFAVHSMYGLPDILNTALVAGYALAFVRWSDGPTIARLWMFGVLVGAALAVKIGGLVALPLIAVIVWKSPRRLAASVHLGLAMAAGAMVFSGGTFGSSVLRSVVNDVYSDNIADADVSPLWNALHYAGTLVHAAGAHVVVLFIIAIASLVATRKSDPVARAGVWTAIGVGCLLHAASIVNFDRPRGRHLLPVLPFLILLSVTGVSRLAFLRRRVASTAAAALMLGASLFAVHPVLGSFRHDPAAAAVTWLRARIGPDDCVSWTDYAGEYSSLLPEPPARCGQPGASSRFLVVHSHWANRLTGRWFLRPQPSAVREATDFDPDAVFPFEDDAEELRFWQRLVEDRDPEWRIRASFGEEWRTVERGFLNLVNRDYGQFETTGRVFVAERAATR